VVVDGDDQPVLEPQDIKVLWSDYARSSQEISIPHYIESHADGLCAKYFTWLEQFTQLNIKNQQLESFFSLNEEFSYYWSTLTSEKSYTKSPSIYLLFKILALEEMITQYSTREVVFIASDRRLAVIIEQIVRLKKCSFIFKYHKAAVKHYSVHQYFKKGFYALPLLLRGVFRLLIFLWKYRVLMSSPAFRQQQHHSKQITIISPFPGVDISKAKKGQYQSSWWGSLHQLLKAEGYFVNWVFMYFDSLQMSRSESVQIQQLFNLKSQHERFCSVYSFFSFKLLVPIVRDYIRLYIKFWQSRAVIRKHMQHSPFSVLLSDFEDSMAGSAALMNIVFYHVFQSCVSRVSNAQYCFYLMENQNWEKTLVYHWKKASHQPIIGFIHASIRAFDFRYAQLNKKYQTDEAICMPTKIAIHGDDSNINLSALGMPKDQVIHVEALRYQYLSQLKPHQRKKKDDAPLQIAVLTGMEESVTIYQCQFIQRLIQIAPEFKNVHFLIKPHPGLVSIHQMAKQYFQGLNYTITLEPFNQIDLSTIDFAIIENSSTIAMECLYMQLPFCLLSYPKGFNLSSLLRYSSLFIRSPDELVTLLKDIPTVKTYLQSILAKDRALFYLDQNMPRLKNALKALA
tara:strand:- start:4692 stop:6566 length:1875 start_codon:yes stop_codon:yes gene_type:complete